MKTARNLTALLLSILLLAALCPPFRAAAEEDRPPTEGQCGENLTWALEENEDSYWSDKNGDPADAGTDGAFWEVRYTLFIKGSGDMYDYRYPEGNEDGIAPPWAPLSWHISRLDVAEGVTGVGSSAFRWSDHLRNISLPESLTRIGDLAFESCRSGEGENENWRPTDGLREIRIPKNVRYIGRQAFANNDYLTDVSFAGDITEVCLAGDAGAEFRHPASRVREVFYNTAWFDAWFEENYTQGTCGENVSWKLEKTDSVWVYDETGLTATDEADFNRENLTHLENRYVLHITGTGAMDDFVYEGVTILPQPWEASSWEISAVKVDEGVTSIGGSAFRWLSNLRSVSLPASLIRIGSFAFEGCQNGFEDDEHIWHPAESLAAVEIPENVSYIGIRAFSNNCDLKTVRFGGAFGDVCLAGDADFADWHPASRVREVFDNTPWYDAWFEENYTQGSCGENVTWKLEKTNSVWVYDDNGQTVTDETDFNKEDLTHLEKRYVLHIMGTGAMDDYGYEDDTTVPQPWEASNWEITAVRVDEGVTSIGSSAFRWLSNLRSVSLPESLTRIGEWAFESCQSGFDEVEFGWHPLESLAAIDIPKNVSFIGRNAFANNCDLETVHFEGALEEVCIAGDENWEHMPAAGRIRAVFENTPWFEKHFMQGECGDSLRWEVQKNGGAWVYDNNGQNVTNKADYGADGTHYEDRYKVIVTGVGDMDNYDFFDGDPSHLPPWDFMAWEITAVEVGEGVTSIGNFAFRWYDHLRTVSLPQSLQRIGEWAFESCHSGEGDADNWRPTDSLRQIEIPKNVSYIGRNAFANNEFLETVRFDGDITGICVAGEDWAADMPSFERLFAVFNNTPWLGDWIEDNLMKGKCGGNAAWKLEKTGDGIWFWVEDGRPVEDEADYGAEGTHYADFYRLTITGEGAIENYSEEDLPGWDYFGINIREIVIGNGVTAIGAGAFADCPEVRELTLPATLRTIGENAFPHGERPEVIYYGYPGDQAAWDAIAIKPGNDGILNARLHVHTPAETIKEKVIPATCTEDGSYEAVIFCKDCGREISRETVTVPSINHDWDKQICEWSDDLTTATVKVICKNDASHVVSETTKPVLSKDLSVAPTCTEKGKNVYMAMFNNKRFFSETKEVEIPALGHTPGAAVKENETAAGYDEVVYCTVCKTELSRQKVDTTPPAPDYTPGDVNGDGKVTAADARLALRAAVGLEDYKTGTAKFLACDVNKDGKITAADARKILRAAVGLEKLTK